MSTSVLVLNKNFYAIAVTDWQRAIGLLYLDHALVVDEAWRTYDFETWLNNSGRIEEHPAGFIHTPSLRIAMPEVIALKMFGNVPQREVTFTRRNIYQHYGHRCCYCGRELPAKHLNLDHVLPRSRGGKTDWSNVVPSCIPCNKRKRNLLPEEAGMELQVRPTRPKPHSGASIMHRFGEGTRRTWRQFIKKEIWSAGWSEA